MNQHEKILEFITTVRDSFYGSETIYTKGSCYQFFKILNKVFPEATAYYDSDHVITRIGSRYYDITGEVLKLIPYKPLVGHKTGKSGDTHWMVFMKGLS